MKRHMTTTEETATIKIVETTVDEAVEAPKPRRKHRKVPPEERALREKKVPKTRDRKAYMKDYYEAHKTITTCEACSLNFVGARALQHHTDHNVRCLLVRINGIVDQLKDKHPGAHDFVEEALRPELVRMQNVMSRPQGKRPPKAAEPLNEVKNESDEKGLEEMQN